MNLEQRNIDIDIHNLSNGKGSRLAKVDILAQ